MIVGSSKTAQHYFLCCFHIFVRPEPIKALFCWEKGPMSCHFSKKGGFKRYYIETS